MNEQELTNYLTKRGFIVDKVEQGFIVHLQGNVAQAEQLFAGLKESAPVHFANSQREIIASLRDEYQRMYGNLQEALAKLEQEEVGLAAFASQETINLDAKIAELEDKSSKAQSYLAETIQTSVDAARDEFNHALARLEELNKQTEQKGSELDKRVATINSELDKKIGDAAAYLEENILASTSAAKEDLDAFTEGIAEQFNELFELQLKEPNFLKKIWRKIRGNKQSDNSSDSG